MESCILKEAGVEREQKRREQWRQSKDHRLRRFAGERKWTTTWRGSSRSYSVLIFLLKGATSHLLTLWALASSASSILSLAPTLTTPSFIPFVMTSYPSSISLAVLCFPILIGTPLSQLWMINFFFFFNDQKINFLIFWIVTVFLG